MNFISKARHLPEDFLVKALIFCFPIIFLDVRHAVHISLYGIFLIGLIDTIKNKKNIQINLEILLIAFSLAAIFLATLLQNGLSHEFNTSAFDGPSRLLIAGLIAIYLYQLKINYLKILEISIPIGLILLLIFLELSPQYYWGNRWATHFVDPNSLGGQALTLSGICLINLSFKSNLTLNFIKVLGFICGFYISLKAGSRGGWAALPVILILWLTLQIKLKRSNSNKEVVITLTTSFLLIAGAFTLTDSGQIMIQRILETRSEINNWFHDPLVYSSAGARMSMWVASIQLISQNLLGYGEIAIKEIAANHPMFTGIHHHGVKDLIQAGPHSDILSKGLSLGLGGVAAYLATIFIPLIIFVRHTNNKNPHNQRAAFTGLTYVASIFTVGLFNETLSLKYLCSFYGLLIACLAADVLRDNSSSHAYNQKAS